MCSSDLVLSTVRLCIQSLKDDCLVLFVVEFHFGVLCKEINQFVATLTLSAQRAVLPIFRKNNHVDELRTKP